MSSENVCPYCGWECVEIVGSPYSGIGRGRCPNCQSYGPEVSPPSAALDTFCNPAHLMQGKTLVDTNMYELTLSMAHKWERICDGEELADVAGEGE